MLCTLLPAVLAYSLAAPAPAEEKFTIKLKNEAQGDVILMNEKDSTNGKSALTVLGKTQPKDEEKTSLRVFKAEFVEKQPGKRATKLKHTYEKAELVKNGKKIEPSFIGKTVLIERDGKDWKFTVDGNKVTGADLEFLNDEFSEKKKSEEETKIEDLMMPKQAVAVDEAWKIDVAGIAKEFGKESPFAVDVEKSFGSGKLVKAYRKDGKQFGVIELNVDLALTKIGAGPMAIELDNTSRMKLTMKFDGCIDGSVHTGAMSMGMDLKMAGSLKTPQGDIKIESVVKANGTQTAEDVTGKK